MFVSLWKSLMGRFDLGRREALHRSCTRKNRAVLQVTALEERALMSAGVLDSSFSGGDVAIAFDAGGQNTDHAMATAVQSDGKIVVVGWAQGPNGDHDFAITRLNSNGSIDSQFGTAGKVRVPFDFAGGAKNDEAYAVAIQDDGKIVVAGRADRSGGDSDMAVLRLNPDGSLDTNFSSDGKTAVFFDLGGANFDAAYGVALKPGKIILAGTAQTGLLSFDMAVAQLEDDGSLDTNFSPGGADGGSGLTVVDFGSLERANAVAIQGTKIILAGNTGNSDMAVARLTSAGALDNTFGPNNNGKTTVAFDLGGGNADTCSAVAIQGDSKIVLAGTVDRSAAGDRDFALARLNPDGDIDTNFGGGDGKVAVAFDLGGDKNDTANAMTLQSDGKILVAGTVKRSASGDTDFGVVRLTSAGALDSTFDGDGKAVVAFDRGGTNADDATGVALQSGGQVVVAGTIQRVAAGDTDFGVARLLGDPPPAPSVTSPAAAVTVDQPTFVIQGQAAAGSLVKVYQDVNNNNQIDAGDTVLGQQQLAQLSTAYAISVPLTQNAANNFLVTATKFNSESTSTDVPTVTDVAPPLPPLPPPLPMGVFATVVRKRGRSLVHVRGAASGELLRIFGPYSGRVRTRMADLNNDGVLDLVIENVKNGRKRQSACDGVTLGSLPVPSLRKR